MIPIVRPAFVALFSLLAAGCQTASLEDAAPKTASISSFDAGTSAIDGSAEGVASDAAATLTSTDDASAPAVIRRNPGFMSPIPIEKTVPVVNKEFVATGASRSGQYPSFGRLPKAANAQFSDYDKLVAEAEMTELLRNRASTPDARAQYDTRLRQLRALAANHGSDTQQEIEK